MEESNERPLSCQPVKEKKKVVLLCVFRHFYAKIYCILAYKDKSNPLFLHKINNQVFIHIYTNTHLFVSLSIHLKHHFN